MSSVRVIIVNYNSARLALESARSVLTHSGGTGAVGITIVENGSTDDSVAVLKAELAVCPALQAVRLVQSELNGGFGAGCNVGFRDAIACGERPEFWWLLNPDAIVIPGALDKLIQVMRSEPKAGVVGGGLVNWHGQLMTACGPDFSPFGEFVMAAQIPSFLRRYASSIPAPCPAGEQAEPGWVCGANMLLRAEALEAVSGFDEEFFLYYEDADLCRGLREAGWKVLHEPAARVVHAVGKSTQIPLTGRWPKYFFESRAWYFRKHLGRWGLIKSDAAWVAGWVLRSVRRWWSLGLAAPQFPERFASDLLWTDLQTLLRRETVARQDGATWSTVGSRHAARSDGFPDRAPGV